MASSTKQRVNILVGSGGIGDASDPLVGYSTPEAAQRFFNIFREYGYNGIDTARGYTPHAPGTSEPLLGQTDIASWAIVDTKILSHPGQHSPENITASLNASLKALGPVPINTLHLHWPDRSSPLLPTLRTINEHYLAGKFKSFGLSNYEAEEVDLVVSLCEQNNFVKPTVYQLHYNAVTRSAEPKLIPTLRRHGIRINAWSPAGGGFLSKSRFRMTSTNRIGDLSRSLYDKPTIHSALEQIHDLADARGLTGHEIALRWIVHHSVLDGEKGDGIVIGARSDDQLRGTLDIYRDKGPLDADVLALVEKCWHAIEESGDAAYYTPFEAAKDKNGPLRP